MVKEILTGAGFVENVTFKETRFLRPPGVTYAIYLDAFDARGSDDQIMIEEHSTTIELYEYAPDPEAEKRVEEQLDLRAIPYTKQSRYWIQDEQLYQVIYDFDHIIKRRG